MNRGKLPGTVRFDLTREDERRVRARLQSLRIIGNETEVDVWALNHLHRSIQYDTEHGAEFWQNILPGRHNLLKLGFMKTRKMIFVSKNHSVESGPINAATVSTGCCAGWKARLRQF